MTHEDDCESAYRAGWRAAGTAIAERLGAAYASFESNSDESAGYQAGYLDALINAESIARNEVRGE